MTLTIAVLSDIHGNLAALDAVLADIATRRPTACGWRATCSWAVPDPRRWWHASRSWRAGRHIVSGNTDIAVTDGDYAAAFPGWTRCPPPTGRPPSGRATSSTTTSWTGSAGCPSSDACGTATRWRCWSMRSPGSQTAGLPADLDPSTTVERVTRTEARVICCGHTHVADVRELGRKLIVNPGACGWSFDGDPAAGWALVALDEARRRPRSCTG